MADDRGSVSDDDPTESTRGPIQIAALVLLAVLWKSGSLVFSFVLVVLGYLIPAAVVVVALAVFFAGILVLDPILSVLGLSDQAIAAIAGGAVMVGVWIVGLKLLIDW